MIQLHCHAALVILLRCGLVANDSAFLGIGVIPDGNAAENVGTVRWKDIWRIAAYETIPLDGDRVSRMSLGTYE
jgi:hypothetical protein